MQFVKEYVERAHRRQAGTVVPVEITAPEDRSWHFVLRNASRRRAKAKEGRGDLRWLRRRPTGTQGGEQFRDQLGETQVAKTPDLNATT